jgi:nitrate/TMAO reductase-like tetraheme cytochrome c subunit
MKVTHMKTRLMLIGTLLSFTVPSFAATETAATKWANECGSCHVAYPAKFLPAATWTKIMTGLDKHFGSDASLDPATNKAIAGYLTANAGSGKHGESPASLRISDTRWFQREHSEEMDPGIFKSPLVKSVANCGACHTAAAKGDYSERSIRIPGQGNRRHDD